MDEEILAAAAVYMYSTYNNYMNVLLKTKNVTPKYRSNNKHLKRGCMVSSNRKTRKGIYQRMLKLLSEPTDQFWSLVHMSSTDFDDLVQKISKNVPQDNRWKAPIPNKIKLALTLRYLATGESYESLHKTFQIPATILSRVVPEVCSAINHVLKDYIKMPTNEEEWLEKSDGFDFPHCLGALDGKHVLISPPHEIGDEGDFKKCFSIVLLTLVDSDYCFISADIGAQDRVSKDDELNQTALWQNITSNSLNLPTDKPLPSCGINMPYVFLGNEAFPLSKHVMIPFSNDPALGTPEKRFNKKLIGSRVFVDNAFGVMSSVFRVLQKPIPLDVEKASAVTLSCILLHNYLRKSVSSRDIYSPPGSFDLYDNNSLVVHGTWRSNNHNSFIQFQPLSCRTEDEIAFQTRLDFMDYINENT